MPIPYKMVHQIHDAQSTARMEDLMRQPIPSVSAIQAKKAERIKARRLIEDRNIERELYG